MTSTSRQYFEEMYRECDDPWNFSTSDYEKRKYEVTLASLPKERYANAFEPGCSLGILSELLAPRCERLLCTDIVASVVDKAKERLKGRNNVLVERLAIPEEWPTDLFELIVLSEVGYYFDVVALAVIIDNVIASTNAGSHVVGVHYRGDTDYPLTAEQVHEQIDERSQLRQIVHHCEGSFLLDVWERTS